MPPMGSQSNPFFKPKLARPPGYKKKQTADVSKMLGHASIDMTKHFARILDTKIMDEMNPFLEKFNTN
jgi:hypothetical protein